MLCALFCFCPLSTFLFDCFPVSSSVAFFSVFSFFSPLTNHISADPCLCGPHVQQEGLRRHGPHSREVGVSGDGHPRRQAPGAAHGEPGGLQEGPRRHPGPFVFSLSHSSFRSSHRRLWVRVFLYFSHLCVSRCLSLGHASGFPDVASLNHIWQEHTLRLGLA